MMLDSIGKLEHKCREEDLLIQEQSNQVDEFISKHDKESEKYKQIIYEKDEHIRRIRRNTQDFETSALEVESDYQEKINAQKKAIADLRQEIQRNKEQNKSKIESLNAHFDTGIAEIELLQGELNTAMEEKAKIEDELLTTKETLLRANENANKVKSRNLEESLINEGCQSEIMRQQNMIMALREKVQELDEARNTILVHLRKWKTKSEKLQKEADEFKILEQNIRLTVANANKSNHMCKCNEADETNGVENNTRNSNNLNNNSKVKDQINSNKLIDNGDLTNSHNSNGDNNDS